MQTLKYCLTILLVGSCMPGCFLFVSQSDFRRPLHQDSLPNLPKAETLTLLLIGDTGKPGAQRDQVLKQVRAEHKDYVIALGDLVYPHPPPCPTGTVLEKDKSFYKERVAGGLTNLGAPVLAVLGNHAYYVGKRSYISYVLPFLPSRREQGDDLQGGVIDPAACMVDYLGQLPEVHLPALDYGLDLGVAQLAFVDTNHLDTAAAQVVAQAFGSASGWKLLIGHHVLKTYHDKGREDYVLPWIQEHGIQADLYANGHAHVLQFGIYDTIPAITSGTGSKLRKRKSCPPDCGDGQLWGESQAGYALLEVTPNRLLVTFKNADAEVLYQWSNDR